MQNAIDIFCELNGDRICQPVGLQDGFLLLRREMIRPRSKITVRRQRAHHQKYEKADQEQGDQRSADSSKNIPEQFQNESSAMKYRPRRVRCRRHKMNVSVSDQ